MAKVTNLTHERLLTVMDYDPATGFFRWKVRSSNRIHVGDRAGVVGTIGHRFIMIDGEKFQASRLAIFYVRGEWPKEDVKFLNENSDDCSISNLQEMSRVEAARLRGAPANNTSGLRGVSPAKNGNWKAAIMANYRQVNLGIYPTKEEASAIYEYAMTALTGKKTSEECDAALDQIVQHRRKLVAWNRLVRTDRPKAWVDFESFSSDVGYVDEEHTTVAAVDEGKPVGPNNFKWLLKPQGQFDRETKEGRAAYARAYREANPARWRHSHLTKSFGINQVEYSQMFEEQGGVCAICGNPETKPRNTDDRELSIDHDHDRGKQIRGLLCGNCNDGLGKFGDRDPKVMHSAGRYLERYYDRIGETKYIKSSTLDQSITAAMTASHHRDWLNVSTLGFGA